MSMPQNATQIVCTLFEGSYGMGAAALFNSLIAAGFSGTVYAGFRGALPNWAVEVQKAQGYVTGSKAKLVIEFVPLDTDWHLTNYKPRFMLQIMEMKERAAEGILYFDPDITIRCEWDFIRDWLGFGMAFCEDVNSPMHATHPRRMMWRRMFPSLRQDFASDNIYVNAGFVGVRRQDLDFLRMWESIIMQAAPFTGGPAAWYGDAIPKPFSPFAAFDQDALNIALMANKSPVSIVGPEGMDFKSGGYIMSHAIGSPKPWIGTFLGKALRGRAPSLADRYFVKNLLSGPLKPISDLQLAIMRLDLFLAKLVSKVLR